MEAGALGPELSSAPSPAAPGETGSQAGVGSSLEVGHPQPAGPLPRHSRLLSSVPGSVEGMIGMSSEPPCDVHSQSGAVRSLVSPDSQPGLSRREAAGQAGHTPSCGIHRVVTVLVGPSLGGSPAWRCPRLWIRSCLLFGSFTCGVMAGLWVNRHCSLSRGQMLGGVPGCPGRVRFRSKKLLVFSVCICCVAGLWTQETSLSAALPPGGQAVCATSRAELSSGGRSGC